MKTLKTLAVFILILSVSNIYSQPVAFDPTFGQNGMTVIPNAYASECHFLDFDNYGNIIAVGTTNNGNKDYLTIVKTNADGIIDQSFGDNGIVNGPECSPTAQFGLKITKENKIFVTGSFYANQYDDFRRTFMQFNENGSLDDTFGENGKIVLNFCASVTTINLESNDFLLFGGYVIDPYIPLIWKCNYNGELDETFGENGRVYLTDSSTFSVSARRIKILKDRSIIIAGHTYFNTTKANVTFCKLDKNGSLVTDFANNGVWRMQIDSNNASPDGIYEYFTNVIEDSNGNLVLLGCVNWIQCFIDLYVFNFNKDGIPNTAFGTDGLCLMKNFGEPQNILQNGSKYLIVSYDMWSYQSKVISIDQNGTLDLSFNNTGVFNFEKYFLLQNMKLQEAKKLILGGSYLYESNYCYRYSLLVRLSIPSDVSLRPYLYTDNSITIFPNPAKDHLYFSCEKKFEIMDIQGRILLKNEKAMQSVNISQLKAGIYFIKFEDGQVRKFIKE